MTEFDVVATDFSQWPVRTILCECKSGTGCKTRDLLQLKGKQYLAGADEAVLVRRSCPSHLKDVDILAQRLGISVVWGRDYAELLQSMKEANLVHRGDAGLADHWLKWYELEDALRQIIQLFARNARKSSTSYSPLAQADKYLCALETDFWWRYPNPWHRSTASYSLHDRWQKLSLKVADKLEAAGEGYKPARHFYSVYAEGRCPPAQGALYVQTRARLAILVAACECALALANDERTKALFYGDELDLSLVSDKSIPPLNPTFREMVTTLAENADIARLLPSLAQRWLYGWGAFFWTDNTSTEEVTLAGNCGVNKAEVQQCVELINRLFTAVPIFIRSERDWFQIIPRGQGDEDWKINTLKMVPEPFKGIGIMLRQDLFPQKAADPPDFWFEWRARAQQYIDNLEQIELGHKKPDSWLQFET